jgi:hypothetical protein
MSLTTKLVLNTAVRTSGKSHCCSFILPNPGIRFSAYEVVKIEIPHSFYNITDANNIIEWVDDTTTSLTSTLTNGNYSTDELLTHIGAVMTASTLAATGTASYSATRDTITDKISFTNNLLANFDINWSTSAITQRLATDLGFFPTPSQEDRGKPTPVDTTGASTHTANNVYWVGKPKNINIKSNLAQLSKAQPSFVVQKGGGSFNILEQILVPTVSGEITTWEPRRPVVVPIRDKLIFEITLELLDENFDLLDLNGQDWNVTLLLHNLK